MKSWDITEGYKVNAELRSELLQMINEDEETREKLAADDSLFEGYHPEMEAVHKQNAAKLRAIIREHGWPGISLVGSDGEEAAWRIAQHSISDPDFMRNTLILITSAAELNEAPLYQVAMMEDRIRMFEGRPQLYGTSFDWDEDKQMSPWPAIEDAESVDQRRANMGLPPLEDSVSKQRMTSEPPPADVHGRRKRMIQWARSVGWV